MNCEKMLDDGLPALLGIAKDSDIWNEDSYSLGFFRRFSVFAGVALLIFVLIDRLDLISLSTSDMLSRESSNHYRFFRVTF